MFSFDIHRESIPLPLNTNMLNLSSDHGQDICSENCFHLLKKRNLQNMRANRIKVHLQDSQDNIQTSFALQLPHSVRWITNKHTNSIASIDCQCRLPRDFPKISPGLLYMGIGVFLKIILELFISPWAFILRDGLLFRTKVWDYVHNINYIWISVIFVVEEFLTEFLTF